MKKIVFMLSLVGILIVMGCSDEGNKVVKEAEKEETAVEEVAEETPATYKSEKFGFELVLEPQLEGVLIAEEKENWICYSMEDTTVLNENVEFGCIEKFLLQEWEEIEQVGMQPFIKIDQAEGHVFAYTSIGEDPYTLHYVEGEVLQEQQDFFTNFHLFHRSLLKSGFTENFIEPNQELPEQLNVNAVAGIDVSEKMLNDLIGWHGSLLSAWEQDVTNDEWFRLTNRIAEEVYTEYPELRQLPFPTFEIGSNITGTIYSLQQLWVNHFYHGVEIERLATENAVLSIGNSIEVIERQLQEIKDTY